MKNEKKDFKFRIDSIDIINTSINAPLNPTEIGELNFDLQIQVKLEPKKNILMVFVDVEIKTKESKEKLGKYTICCSYIIEDFEELVSYDNANKPTVPKIIIDTLNSISISTLRGLMFGSFRGTFLHKAILPVVDPKLIEAHHIV